MAEIIADIRERGDDALLAFTARYDGLAAGSVAELAIPGDVLQAALDGLDDALDNRWNWQPPYSGLP